MFPLARSGAPTSTLPDHRRTRRIACAVAALLAALALAPHPASARPVSFPPLPDGRREWRDERDVTPYLSAWKAEGLRRARGMRVAMTPNQEAYDARTYDLDLSFDPAAGTVSGTVRMRATVVHGPLAAIDLDLVSDLAVDSVAADGAASTFSRAGDVLTVALARPAASGEAVEVSVTYHGTPPRTGPFGGAIAITTVHGRTLISSLSEPYGARSWWPCKDVPGDKADSVDLRFTVPSGLVTASNGTELGSSDDGTVAVSRWHERHPIATYLVSIASYPYARTRDWYRPAGGDSMPIEFFNFPESVTDFTPGQSRVKDMIAVFADRFGDYPFHDEKYGHAQFMFGGGMENQTCTSIGVANEWVMAHELSHQWWGDHVTCRDFHHIWLNEGFATYAEALWDESQGGLDAYLTTWAVHPFFGAGTVFVPDTTDESRIFDGGLTYLKGGWILHMLRGVMGDASFFASLRAYGARYGGGNASTEDFRDVCEQVSGLDLHRFFEQWVYGEYYPVYRPEWTSHPAGTGYDVTLRLDQIQSWQLFRMPLAIRIATRAGDRTFTIADSLASQVFRFHVSARPLGVLVDPDHWVLRRVEQPVSDPAFDRPLLLVNDAEWYWGDPLTAAYADSAFSGVHPFDFWDARAVPRGTYPSALPAPLGIGEVPAYPLGHYRNVIWVGDFTPAAWHGTPVESYLRAGGNLLLMTSDGWSYLSDSLRSALGIDGLFDAGQTDCVATLPRFLDLVVSPPTQSGFPTAGFPTGLTRPDARLWFRTPGAAATATGVGAIAASLAAPGASRTGGRLAFLSGAPWFWGHLELRADVTALMDSVFGEPSPGGGGSPPVAPRLELAAPAPNPFAASTTIALRLGVDARVRIVVHDLTGRRVRTLWDGPLAAGDHPIAWDGRDDDGRETPAGVYWVTARSGADAADRKLVRLP